MEKYDVISVVGEGSYGLVMRCRHRESGQYVAIKKFLETEDDPTVRKMAMREIRMLKKLRHENLVNMIEVFRRKKRFFLVFEYLEHTVLEELESRTGGLGFITSRKYIYQVLRALDFIHSNDVIHRDIKPENVLVSRQGVIKLCDFGFARPYAENETFTDYVATRWYRSPELLVGDPRYGKEVDIWAAGCLYAEMMTGEPLFPGESDIDQLFQIVRVLGKLNARHQILVTRNTMFKGMKQEQSSSLLQLFPDWNRDSLEFLSQCLKMDGMSRPDTVTLLKHELFTRDDFLDNFLPELRSKINHEMQKNPLLTRFQGFGSGRGNQRTLDAQQMQHQQHKTTSEEKHKVSASENSKGGNVNPTTNSITTSVNTTTATTNNSLTSASQFIEKYKSENKMGVNGSSLMNPKSDRISQIGLTLFPTKTIDSHLFKTSLSGNDEFNLNLTSYKHYLNPNKSNTTSSNPTQSLQQSQQQQQHKHININNLTFKDGGNAQKYARVLSAKPKASSHQNSGGNDVNNLQPPSPVQFQSLQTESLNTTSYSTDHQQQQLHHNHQQMGHHQKTSPININNLTLNGNLSHYFNNKRSSNILALQKNNKQSPLNFNGRNNLVKRDRGILLDVGLSPYGFNPNDNTTPGNILSKEPSPRVLPPPQWLTGNLKITSQGKTTQIGKRGITDWKTISSSNPALSTTIPIPGKDDFTLPNCPGASTSPYKGLKKKLSPMPTLSHDSQHLNTSPRNLTPEPPNLHES